MKYLSVCSGIEAASVAWHPLGWEPVGFAEIEKFPSQVLAHWFPGVKNFGDMIKFKEWNLEPGTIDLLVGGTPCQAFSVAGLRKGLADPRGNLALTFVAMVDFYRPEWVVWENVPGVLSSNGGRDFGSFLGALGQLGYGFAYRVLDAQYFGVAQRRRRVFLVAHSSGDPTRAASVLFEPESLCGDPPPSREAGQKTTSDPGASASGGGLWDTVGALCADTHPGAYSGQDAYAGRIISDGCWWDGGQVSQTLDAVLTQYQTMPEKNRFPAVLQPSLYESHPQDCRVTGPVEQCPKVSAKWGTGGNNTPLVTDGGMHFRKSKRAQSVDDDETWVESEVTNTMNVFDQGDVRATDVVVQPGEPSAFTYSGYSNQPAWMTGNRTDCLSASGHSDGSHQGIGIVQTSQASAFSWQCRGDMRGMVPRPTAQLQRCQIEAVMVQPSMHVRRLTPVECERLQGFPDGWTDIRPGGKDTPDSPRYKALGNSMAVPVMRWIGQRIESCR